MKKYNLIKKAIGYLIIVIISIVLMLNIFSALKISFFGYRMFQVQTGSMEPKLKVNDLIIIKKQNNYKKNDIITYKENNSYVTHRIIEINDDEIITKGDANNTIDKKINKKQIIGKVVLKFRLLNSLNKLLRNYMFLTLLFIIGMFMIIVLPSKKK